MRVKDVFYHDYAHSDYLKNLVEHGTEREVEQFVTFEKFYKYLCKRGRMEIIEQASENNSYIFEATIRDSPELIKAYKLKPCTNCGAYTNAFRYYLNRYEPDLCISCALNKNKN